MQSPEIPKNELERLAALKSYGILDTLSEKDYDNLTAITSEICDTPISLISIIDDKRQWFKSHHGLSTQETPKEYAFCSHAINKPEEVLIVPDSRQDKRFHDNPLVTGDPRVIFYAGVPLIAENGFPLGTLCVIDNKPKSLTKSQIKSLAALSNQVMKLMELRKKTRELNEAVTHLETRNSDLQRFAYTAAHDLKSPLNNVSSLLHLFTQEYGNLIDADGHKMLNRINGSTENLRGLIDSLLKYSEHGQLLKEEKTIMDIATLENDITHLFWDTGNKTITFTSDVTKLYTNRAALIQILLNLVSNAIKYNDKASTEIDIGISNSGDDSQYNIYVQDNGPGIAPDKHDKIFELFTVLEQSDRFGVRGNGIGLATVKKLVLALGGTIHVESEIGKGTKFMFSIEK